MYSVWEGRILSDPGSQTRSLHVNPLRHGNPWSKHTYCSSSPMHWHNGLPNRNWGLGALTSIQGFSHAVCRECDVLLYNSVRVVMLCRREIYNHWLICWTSYQMDQLGRNIKWWEFIEYLELSIIVSHSEPFLATSAKTKYWYR